MTPSEVAKAVREKAAEKAVLYEAQYARAIQRYKARSPHWPAPASSPTPQNVTDTPV